MTVAKNYETISTNKFYVEVMLQTSTPEIKFSKTTIFLIAQIKLVYICLTVYLDDGRTSSLL